MAVQLREVECRWCGQIFFVCQRCDFGRWYCGEPCGRKARERYVRCARRDYAGSQKGRRNNRERQRRLRRRLRTAGNIEEKQNSVTDQSSQVGLPGISYSYDKPPAEPDPPEQTPTVSSTQSDPVYRTLRQPLCAPHGSDATKEVAKLAAKVASRVSGCPVRVAQCHFCGRWGVVVETTAIRGRFRRRSHGKHMSPRRRE